MSDKPREYAYSGKLEEAMRLEAQAEALEKIICKELEIIGLKPSMKVLDAGCGTGAVTRRMASKILPEKAYGVDVDPVFIDAAKKSAVREGVKNIHFERARARVGGSGCFSSKRVWMFHAPPRNAQDVKGDRCLSYTFKLVDMEFKGKSVVVARAIILYRD